MSHKKLEELNDIIVTNDIQEILEEYRKRVKDNLSLYKKENLIVCILGPNKGAKYWYKRRNMRTRISEDENCICIFLEEELQELYDEFKNRNLKDIEIEYLDKAEFIIALDVSKGVHAEIHDFAQFDTLARKMLLLIPDWEKNSYSSKSLVRNTIAKVHYFSEKSLKKCNLIDMCMINIEEEKGKKRAGRWFVEKATWLKKRYNYE